jgi:hypothetical protein
MGIDKENKELKPLVKVNEKLLKKVATLEKNKTAIAAVREDAARTQRGGKKEHERAIELLKEKFKSSEDKLQELLKENSELSLL